MGVIVIRKRTNDALLYSQDLDIVSEANGNPVRLVGGPLDLIYLPMGGVGQDRDLDGLGHLLDVPYESLLVVGCRRCKINTAGIKA